MDANLTFRAVAHRGIPGRWACLGCVLQKCCRCTHIHKTAHILIYGRYHGMREDQMCKTGMGKYKTISESTDFFSSFFSSSAFLLLLLWLFLFNLWGFFNLLIVYEH